MEVVRPCSHQRGVRAHGPRNDRWILEDAGTNCDRWLQVIKDLSHLHPTVRAEAIASLTQRAEQGHFAESERERLWSELRELAADHREYSDAQWALPSDQVDELEHLRDLFTPVDVGHRYLWLFANRVTLGDGRRTDDFAENRKAIDVRRADAVEMILHQEGLVGVFNFAIEAQVSGQVGASLSAAVDADVEELVGWLDATDNEHAALAFGFFAHRFTTGGWPWLDELINRNRWLSPATLASLLRVSWDPREAAERADRLGMQVAHEYWSKFRIHGLGHDFSDVVPFSARLVSIGRTAAALNLLALYSNRSDESGYAEVILVAFEALINNPTDPEVRSLSSYEIENLLKRVAIERETLGINRVARLEWYFLPLLGFDARAPTLHVTLTEDPAFFVELLSEIYRSSDDAEREPTSDDETGLEEAAYRLLHAWKTCPGATHDGTVDLERLRIWVDQARTMLVGAGRAKVGDESIGEALAAAPPDHDGSWPCQAVRDLLEELRNDDVDRGLQVKVFNNRGGTSRSLDEGGRQERELAEKYSASERQFLERWPRSAAIMRQLADTYESHARREDAEAERRRRGLDR